MGGWLLIAALTAWLAAVPCCSVSDPHLLAANTATNGTAGNGMDTPADQPGPSDAGGDGASDAGAPGLGARCVGCSLLPIGAPSWQPCSAVVVTNPAPGGGVAAGLQGVLAPNHVWYPAGFFGPGQPHMTDYPSEVVSLLDAALLPPSQIIASMESAPTPNVLLVVTLVPGPQSPFGRSVDVAQGRVIGDQSFPIHASADVTVPATPPQPLTFLAAHQDLSIPSYGDLDSSAVDGASHVLVAFDLEGGLVPGTLVGSAKMYGWFVIITDSSGAGWELQVPFQVDEHVTQQ
jgi:hypothetical protein